MLNLGSFQVCIEDDKFSVYDEDHGKLGVYEQLKDALTTITILKRLWTGDDDSIDPYECSVDLSPVLLEEIQSKPLANQIGRLTRKHISFNYRSGEDLYQVDVKSFPDGYALYIEDEKNNHGFFLTRLSLQEVIYHLNHLALLEICVDGAVGK